MSIKKNPWDRLQQVLKERDEGKRRAAEPFDLDKELLAKLTVEDFSKITAFLAENFPHTDEEGPEVSVALIIALGASYESFLHQGKKIKALTRDMEFLIRKAAEGSSETFMAAAEESINPKAKA
jgi:hypothetical protein